MFIIYVLKLGNNNSPIYLRKGKTTAGNPYVSVSVSTYVENVYVDNNGHTSFIIMGISAEKSSATNSWGGSIFYAGTQYNATIFPEENLTKNRSIIIPNMDGVFQIAATCTPSGNCLYRRVNVNYTELIYNRTHTFNCNTEYAETG